MALLFTVLLGVSAAILIYFLNDFSRQDFIRETEAAIDAEISAMLAVVDEHDPTSIEAYVRQRVEHLSHARFIYMDAEGKPLAGDDWSIPPDVKPLAEGVLRFSIDSPEGAMALAAKIHTFPDSSRVIVARDIQGLITSYTRLKWLSFVIMGLMLAVVLVSFAISFFVVGRINLIAGIAQRIMETGDLSQRISVESKWDDLSNLADVLNSFLERIEALMQGIREVSSSIAHDLRTPLTSLRHDIETLKQRLPEEPEVDRLLVEADRLLALFQSLLRITSLEQGRRPQAFTEVELRTLLQDVIELYEPLAEERSLRLHIDFQVAGVMEGDADLLFQLFTNLVDNAIKFSPAGGSVTLGLARHESGLQVTVEDQGPGITEVEKEKVFRHFYRGDASRSTPGHGLGLSLAKAVVEMHHGRITLNDNVPGLRVCVTFSPYQ